MLFNSFNFWLIFPFIFSIYWIIPSKFHSIKKFYLIAISYVLYMLWDVAHSLILFGITILTFYGAIIIERLKNKGKSYKRKMISLIFVIISFFPLFIFKYYNFITNSTSQLFANIGFNIDLPGLNWAIPIGISFFSFQAIGYLLDVYHNRINAEHNFIDYTLFVSFFPQITSGPISKADDLIPQLKNLRPFCYKQGVEGLQFLLWGMFIKVVVADRLGIFTDTVYSNYTYYSGADCFIASIFYSIQIYGDFAGYSLMAMGIAKCLGINLINNFNRPYFATSITSFWKRWHISLTKWLTSQIYIPLGGSRCSKARTYGNIMITFLVSGIWHGANCTFIVWGAMHGLLQIIEKHFNIQNHHTNNILVNFIKITTTFMLVNFAWILFRMPTITDASNVFSQIFTSFPGEILYGTSNSDKFLMLLGIIILFSKEAIEEFFHNKIHWDLFSPILRFSIYIIIFAMIISIGVLDAGQFIYVNF